MNIKKIVFYVMCALLAIMIIVSGITIGKAGALVGSILNPAPPATDSTVSTTEGTEDSTDSQATNPPTTGTVDSSHQHSYKEFQSFPATCTEDGYTLYKCSCGDVETRDMVNALGHSYGVGKMVTACVGKDVCYTEYACSRCDHVDKRDITDGTGHKFDIEEEIPASCEHDACIIRKCSNPNCTETETEFITGTSLGGHDYSILVEEVEATCTTEGHRIYRCANKGCNAEPKKEVFKPTGHTFDQWKSGSGGKQTKCVNPGCDIKIYAEQIRITKEYRNEDGTHYVIEVGTGTGVNDLRQLYDYNIIDKRSDDVRASNPLNYRFDSEDGFVVEYTDESGTAQEEILGFASNSLTIEGTGHGTTPEESEPRETMFENETEEF